MALGGNTLGLYFRIGTTGTDGTKKDVTDLRTHFNKEVAEIKKGGTDAFLSVGNSAGLSAQNMAQMATVASTVAIGITAVAGAAIAAGTAIFALAKNFSDAGSAIHDTAQQMGVSAEMASVLKFAAEQSGKSFESLSAPIAKFSILVGAAARGSEEAAAKLKRFGLDPQSAINDLDGALAKVFKTIHDAPEGIARTTLAADAFGAKVGASLIPVIETMNGDLVKFSDEARKAGVVMSQADADAADKFGDTLGTLQTQLKFTSYVFAAQFAPVIEQGMKDLSKTIRENKNTIKEWGSDFADVLRGIRSVADSELGSVIALIARVGVEFSGVPGLIRSIRDIGASAKPGAVDPGLAAIINMDLGTKSRWREKPVDTGDIFDPAAGKGGKAKKEPKDELAPFRDILEDVNRALTLYGDKTEHSRIQQEFLQKGLEKLNPTLRAQAEELMKVALRAADVLDVKKLLTEEEKKADEAAQKSADTFREFGEEQLKQLEAGKSALRQAQEFIVVMEKQGHVLNENQKFWIQTRGWLIDVKNRVTDLNDVLKPLADTLEKLKAPEETKVDVGKPPPADENPWAIFAEQVKRAVKSVQQSAKTMQDAFATVAGVGMGVLEGFAQGIGDMVTQWVLMGDQADMSMGKMLAAVLASVAGQAAAMAIMAFAYGLLALTPWGAPLFGPAALDFQAAALFASIAVVAGLAGRALAGDSFQSKPAAAGGGSSGGGGGATSAPSGPIDIGRREGMSVEVHNFMHVSMDDGVIAEKVMRKYEKGGKFRDFFLGDGVKV